jgi:hypothetical protein
VKAGPWRFLLYIVPPRPTKMAVLPDELRIPGLRHMAGVLAIETRRRG